MKMSQFVVAIFVVVTLVALGSWLQPTIEVAPNLNVSQAEPAITLDATATDSLDVKQKLQSLRTFKGASQDGALRTDHRNNLVIDMQLRHWIDYHLTAQGELTIAEITELMQQQMNQLPEPARQQALALLDDYLGYLQALAGYDDEAAKRINQPGMSDIEARILWQQRLRREWLEPDVVTAFFAGDEEIDLYTIEQFKLRKENATPEQMAALEELLPEPVREMRRQSRKLIHMETTERQLKEEGASNADIHAWRVQEYGPQAAERLAALDQKNAEWRERLQQYQSYQQSDALMRLGETDREKLLQAYRKKHFNTQEQKRLSAALQLLTLDN